jgi:hypothetical protein
MLPGMDDVVDLADLAAICGEVLSCYDRFRRPAPRPDVTDEAAEDRVRPCDGGVAGAAREDRADGLDRVLAETRALPGIPGRVWWALDLVGRGASGATPAELARAVEVLRGVAAGRAPAERDVARL